MKRIYLIMFSVSVALMAASVVLLGMYGLRFGIDFTGGSILEVQFENGRPPVSEIAAKFDESKKEFLHGLSLTPVGDKGLIVRSTDRSQSIHGEMTKTIDELWPDAGAKQLKFDFIGPVVGSELKGKSITAIVVLLIAVSLYIAVVFAGMRRTLSWWVMSFATLAALAHDVLLPLGLFAWLGHFRGVEVGAVFVAAILTIMGYSISDTVVVFDRVRENVLRGSLGKGSSFASVVHASVMQTLVRSVNTSLTTLLSLVAIFLFGGGSLRYFALALIVGIFSGAYSSIFVASPLLVWLSGEKSRK